MGLDDREKLAVRRMRSGGLGYKAIAARIGVSRDQVRSYLSRTPVTAEAVEEGADWCCWCGKTIRPERAGQRFCCSEHRLSWWHTHPDQLNRKAVYEFTCPNCGQAFTAYGNRSRKYCCHACYVRHRFATRGGRP